MDPKGRIVITAAMALAALLGCDGGGAKHVEHKDRIPRPQSPDYHGGRLQDKMLYFYGRVEAGRVVQTLTEKGELLDGGKAMSGGSTIHHTIQFQVGTSAPCLRQGANLPLYKLDEGGTDLCYDHYEPTPQERARCEHCDQCADKQIDHIQNRAVAIPGRWDEAGNYTADAQVGGVPVFTFACTTGTAGKCAQWGYLPWLDYDARTGRYSDPRDPKNPGLRPYYVACVHAARADYEANGKFMTCNATIVDVFDNLGINPCEDGWQSDAGAPSLESTWGPDGKPACIRRPRYGACTGLGDASCDSGYDPNRCPTTWPANTILRVRSPSYGGPCPTSKEVCKKQR